VAQNDRVIVVSGLPRSGTSLMMKLLETAGVPILSDGLRKADVDNLGGYYEYEPVKWMKERDNSWMAQALGKAVKIISHLLFYLPPGYSYRVVFMLRDLGEVAASQNQMLKNRGEASAQPANDPALRRVFEDHLAKVKAWLAAQPNIAVTYIDYNKLMLAPTEELDPLAEFLRLPLNAPDIISVINPSYYRQRSNS
jgi:hypothetical protein